MSALVGRHDRQSADSELGTAKGTSVPEKAQAATLKGVPEEHTQDTIDRLPEGQSEFLSRQRSVWRIALCQLDVSLDDPEANVERSVKMAQDAVAKGAHLVVLPELAACGFPGSSARALSLSWPLDRHPALAAWTKLAKETGIVLVGGFAERENTSVYNSAVLLDRSGVLGVYRKLHLFGPEHAIFTPGNTGLPVFHVPGTVSSLLDEPVVDGGTGVCRDAPQGVRHTGRDSLCLGIAICYDLRFPEVVRILALQGADLLVVPTAWVAGFDKASHLPDGTTPQYRTAAVQANLSQVWIGMADRVGTDPVSLEGHSPLSYLGASCAASPTGQLVAGPASSVREETVFFDCDLGAVREAQTRGAGISPRAQRRTDVYGEILGYKPRDV